MGPLPPNSLDFEVWPADQGPRSGKESGQEDREAAAGAKAPFQGDGCEGCPTILASPSNAVLGSGCTGDSVQLGPGAEVSPALCRADSLEGPGWE